MNAFSDQRTIEGDVVKKVRALKILVVDDHPSHQILARLLFEALGCGVSVARDGLQGARMAHNVQFDVILMDRHMPRCDGDTATRIIRSSTGRSRQAMIVCHSTEPPKGDVAQAYDAVIAKPARLVDIVHLLGASPS